MANSMRTDAPRAMCLSTVFLLGSLLAPGGEAEAGDAEAGRAKSKPCVVCHGVDGNSPQPINPKLAGQHEEVLINAMRAYQDKRRVHPVKQALMRPLSDEDIRDLAAYFASQPCR